VRDHLAEMVRGSVEETLKALPQVAADGSWQLGSTASGDAA
jgi:hypothetical protein